MSNRRVSREEEPLASYLAVIVSSLSYPVTCPAFPHFAVSVQNTLAILGARLAPALLQ